jgi:phosphosulfolactate synthase
MGAAACGARRKQMASLNASLALPPRSVKPRRRGITSMIDFGPDGFGWTGGAHGIRDLLDCAGEYIDYAKIYALNSLLMPERTVSRAVGLYRDAGVMPFAGGILFEYAWRNGALDDLVRLLQRLGLPALEISENYVTLSEDERTGEIERFQRRGIAVIYEFGRKNPEQPMSLDVLGQLVGDVAAQGIDHVTVEQSEIDLLAQQSPESLRLLGAQPWFEHVLIEVDPYRFPQQHVQLLRDFGAEVNLANVTPGQVLRLEGLRRGIGRAVNYSVLSGDGPAA